MVREESHYPLRGFLYCWSVDTLTVPNVYRRCLTYNHQIYHALSVE